MKLIVSLYEVESLIRNHYKLSGGDRIVISRPRKAAGEIKTLTPVKPTPHTVMRRIDAFIADNQKIAAIKEYRTATMLGLKEAKDAIEDWTKTRSHIANFGEYPRP